MIVLSKQSGSSPSERFDGDILSLSVVLSDFSSCLVTLHPHSVHYLSSGRLGLFEIFLDWLIWNISSSAFVSRQTAKAASRSRNVPHRLHQVRRQRRKLSASSSSLSIFFCSTSSASFLIQVGSSFSSICSSSSTSFLSSLSRNAWILSST